MSEIISKSSTNDVVLTIARNIIFNQNKEIFIMKTLYIENKYSINETCQNKIKNFILTSLLY
jgi:hypothetical protein